MVSNLSLSGWRLTGDLPMRPGDTLSLSVTLPDHERIDIPEAIVRWSTGREFAVENVVLDDYTTNRLRHYVNRLVRASAEPHP